MTMRPSKFVERGKIDTLTQIHDLSLTLFLPLYLFIVFIYFISYVGLFVLWCFNATFNKFLVLSWRSVFSG
jgi:hypothetical protein